MLKIGDTLYLYLRSNENRRGYDGKMAPLWNEHKITGESPTHWHVEQGRFVPPRKIRKTTLFENGKGGYSGHQWYTAEGKVEREWRGRHQTKIGNAVAYDAELTLEQLKQIAKIIGYKENEQ